MTARDGFRALVCALLCLGIALIGSYATVSEIPVWYAKLTKPIWTPPNSVFPIAWTLLYVMIAASLWLLWSRTPPSPRRSLVLALFLVQLALNAAWSPVFFGGHAIMTGLVVIAVSRYLWPRDVIDGAWARLASAQDEH